MGAGLTHDQVTPTLMGLDPARDRLLERAWRLASVGRGSSCARCPTSRPAGLDLDYTLDCDEPLNLGLLHELGDVSVALVQLSADGGVDHLEYSCGEGAELRHLLGAELVDD